MGTPNVDRLLSVLKQHEPLLEERLRDVRPERVEDEAMKFLQRLFSDRVSRRLHLMTLAKRQMAHLKAVVVANPGFAEDISNLDLLDDQALWNAAQTGMPPLDSKRMEELHRRQRLTGLSEAEAQELARLEQQYERVILVRSHSAWLLEQRGHDIRRLTRATKSTKPAPGR